MKNNVIIDGISFSHETARTLECAAVRPHEDIKGLRRGDLTRASLLALCLDGSDPADSESWHEYVSAVAIAAGVT